LEWEWEVELERELEREWKKLLVSNKPPRKGKTHDHSNDCTRGELG
jgi:hypothetical protein